MQLQLGGSVRSAAEDRIVCASTERNRRMIASIQPQIDLGIVGPDYLDDCLRLLLYGETGTGKTWLAAQADDIEGMKPALFLDMDRGTKAITHRDGTDPNFHKLDVVPVYSMKKMELVIKYLKVVDHPYKTIIMDGVSALVQTLLDERLMVPDRKGFDAYVPTRQDYLFVMMRIRKVIQTFKKCGLHYICVANVRVESDVSGLTESFPELIGRQARGIGREFDVVGYTYVNIKPDRSVIRFLQTAPFAARAAKCRSPHPLPSVMTDPTMQQIYDLLIGNPPGNAGVKAPGAVHVPTLSDLEKEN